MTDKPTRRATVFERRFATVNRFSRMVLETAAMQGEFSLDAHLGKAIQDLLMKINRSTMRRSSTSLRSVNRFSMACTVL